MLKFTKKFSWFVMLQAIILLFGYNTAKASHVVGGDAFYTCLGNNQYQVTFALYRDCQGISMDANLFVTVSGCGNSFNVTLNPSTTRFGVEITPVCPTQLPNTTCTSPTGTIQGTQVYEYTGIITLPSPCDMWSISYTTCCRNGNITNGVANSMYIETRINNTNGICNNSARFTSLPTPYICAGQLFNFNHGAVDIDGDSLIYELISPLETSPTTFYTFQGGATATQPFFTTPPASLVFSNNTGQMTFTPSGPQTSVTAIRVYEIRNGDTIGITMRDIQVVVLPNCVNQPVVSSPPIVNTGGSFDTTSRTFVVCQCQTLNFVISAKDQNGDTLTLNSALSNIGTVFGTSNVTIFPFYPIPNRRDTLDLYIQIRTCDAPLGVNGFTIVITDNACPLPSNSYLGFNVIIPGVNILASDTTLCAGIAHNVQLGAQTFSLSGAAVPGRFQWSQISGPPGALSNDTISSPTLAIPGNTLPGDSIRLAVQYITTPDPVSGTFCVTGDTVVIRFVNALLSMQVAASDSSLCQNGLPNAVQFSSTVSGPGVNQTGGVYSWSTIPANRITDLSSTTINNPIGQIAGTPGDSASYIIQYTYGACIGRDTVEVFFNPGFPNVTPAVDTICPGDIVQLNSNLTDTFFYAAVPNQYIQSSVPYNPISCANGIPTGANTDDVLSPTLPIGFNFTFYGQTYTQFKASSNGFITFDAASTANGCCTGGVIPNTATPNNLIALCWEDLNPGSCGSITYFTTGTAPNRKLVVCYNGVCFFGSTTNTVTGQIILHEGTNCVEIQVTSITPPGTFDLMTMGMENATGTAGSFIPGRNSQNWSASNEGWLFCGPTLFDPITYSWTPNIQLSNDTIRNPTVTPAGNTTYYVEITEGNCLMRDSAIIVVNSSIPAPVVTCGLPANYPTEILFNWSGSTGATGWQYSIDSGASFITVPLTTDSLLLTGFGNGDCYQIQVRATGGAAGLCPANAATLFTCCTQPCFNPTQIASTSFANLSCFGSNNGSITFLGTNGDQGPNYTFTLYDAATGLQIQTPQTTPASHTFTNLPAGSYYVEGFDAFGCVTKSDTVIITQPIELAANLAGTTLTSCWNTQDGTAQVTQVGGVAPFTYIWNDNNAQTTASATGLSLGTYSAVVIDANNCRDTVRNINVFGPFAQAPFVSLIVNPSSGCPGNGNATILSVQSMAGDPNPGGPNSLSYSWGDQFGNSVGNDILNVQNLLAGTYFLTVTDTSGCVFVDTFDIAGARVNIDSTISNNPDCNFANGSISVIASGDPLGYNYFWSNGLSTSTINGLGGGNFSVTVVGVGGCQDTASFVLSAAGISAVVSALDERVCPGATTGFININTSSFGGGTVTYLWSNGETTQNVSGLGAGTYSLTVTLNGALVCVANPVATIRESSQLLVNPNVVSCGTLQANPSGGWANFYNYQWENGETSQSVNGLAPGNYTVTVTDAEGCTNIDSVSFANPVFNANVVNCGTLEAVTNGPISSIQWSNGGSGSSVSGVLPGTYSVTVTDNIGCSSSDTVSFDSPVTNAFIGSIAGVVVDSQQAGTSVSISAGSNTPQSGVTYSWSPSANLTSSNTAQAQVVSNLAEGTYQFIVTADNGICAVTDTVTLILTPIEFTGLPSAFSPNGDGNNDMFRPTPYPLSGVEVISFEVFNRWGIKVYESKTTSEAIEGWDGKVAGQLQPRDIYIYTFSYLIPGQTTPTVTRGQVTLLR